MVSKLIDITRIPAKFFHEFISFDESFLSILDFPGRLTCISLQEAIHVGLTKSCYVSFNWARQFLSETFLYCRRIIYTDFDSHLRRDSVEMMVNTAVNMLLLTSLTLIKHIFVIIICRMFDLKLKSGYRGLGQAYIRIDNSRELRDLARSFNVALLALLKRLVLV